MPKINLWAAWQLRYYWPSPIESQRSWLEMLMHHSKLNCILYESGSCLLSESLWQESSCVLYNYPTRERSPHVCLALFVWLPLCFCGSKCWSLEWVAPSRYLMLQLLDIRFFTFRRNMCSAIQEKRNSATLHLAIAMSKGILLSWQQELSCIQREDVRRGKNLVYTLPTSAGKTFVAEVLLLRTILGRMRSKTGVKCLMVLPFVSLVKEKAKVCWRDGLCGWVDSILARTLSPLEMLLVFGVHNSIRYPELTMPLVDSVESFHGYQGKFPIPQRTKQVKQKKTHFCWLLTKS